MFRVSANKMGSVRQPETHIFFFGLTMILMVVVVVMTMMMAVIHRHNENDDRNKFNQLVDHIMMMMNKLDKEGFDMNQK
jgi:heme/copper-type cytochrome/quinol oxidase subunit 2